MTVIIDYGAGNLFSLVRSLEYIGEKAVVTSDAEVIRSAERLILPGVGAFGETMAKLSSTGLIPAILDFVSAGKPLLGICLGMQMLFTQSREFGIHAGLGLIPGEVVSLADSLSDKSLKIPHMGWNRLDVIKEDPFLGEAGGEYVYYVHSFHAVNCEECTLATSEYGINVTGAVRNKNVIGTQFHPEKSGTAGLSMLKAFIRMK